MKKYSKVLALLLCFVLVLAPVSIVNADSVTVTAGGEALGATLANAQKTFEITFDKAVKEDSLAGNVKLQADVTKENALHLTSQPTAWDSGMRVIYQPSAPFVGGKVSIKFDVHYSSMTGLPTLTITGKDGNNANAAGVGATTALQGTQYIMKGQSHNLPAELGNTLGKWNTVEETIDLTNKQYSYVVNGVTVIDNRPLDTKADTVFSTDVEGQQIPNISEIRFDDPGYGDVQTYYKDISISYTAKGSTTPDVFTADMNDYEEGTGKPGCFTYGASITDTNCVIEKVVTSAEDIALSGSLSGDGRTYTVTYEGDWDTEKDYVLTVGKGIKYAEDDTAVLTADIEKAFTVLEPVKAVTVKAGGAELADQLDLAEKTINVEFDRAVDENTLADNISLITVGKREKALHFTNPVSGWNSGMYAAITPSEPLVGGTLAIKYDVFYTTDGYPMIEVLGAGPNGAWPGTGATTGIKGVNYLKNGQDGLTLPAEIGNTMNKWNTVELEINLSAKKYTYVVNDVQVFSSALDTKADSVFTSDQNGAQVPNIAMIKFTDNFYGNSDITYKNMSVVYTADGSSEPTVWDTDFSKFDVGTGKPSLAFTYGASTTNENCVIEEVMTGSENVEVSRSLSSDGKVYSLTNEGTWDIAKEYLLTVGKGVKYSGGATVIAEDIEKSFVVRNLTGSVFTLDSIETTDGAAIGEGGYVPATAKGINLNFSKEVNPNSLAGITLKKNQIDRVLNTRMKMDASDYSQYLLVYDLSGKTQSEKTSGTYTFTASVIVDTEGYDDTKHYNYNNVPFMTFNGVNSSDTKTEIASLQAKHDKITMRTWPSSGSAQDNFNASLPKGTWKDVTFTYNAGERTYTCTAVDPLTGLSENWASEISVTNSSAYTLSELAFGIYHYGADNTENKANGGDIDVSWKDVKLTYTSGETTTTLFEIDTDRASESWVKDTFAEYSSHASRGDINKGTSAFNNEYVSEGKNIEIEALSEPGSDTVSVIPKEALEYLGRYILTVPNTVMSEDSVALDSGKVLNFVAVYSEKLYSAISGFKAGGSDIYSIASNYTGDIIGWADVTNISGKTQSAVIVVALYKSGKLVDVDVVDAANIANGETKKEVSGTVTIETDKAGSDYQAAVYVWESTNSMIPASVKTTTK